MFLMMAEVLQLAPRRAEFPGNSFWSFLGLQPDPRRVGWLFAARHDSALVFVSGRRGAALFDCQPDGQRRYLRQAVRRTRCGVPCCWSALGVFLRSMHSPQTNFTFEDTLTQIGLGYPFLFLLGFRPPKMAMDRARRDPLGLLAGVGALSAPGRELRLAAVGVPADWQPSLLPALPRTGTRTPTWAARSINGS